jgi:hypothetical protein
VSHELQIWSLHAFAPCFLKQPGRWVQSNDQAYRLSKAGWQIVIHPSEPVRPDDIPDEVAALLPGIEYRTVLKADGDARQTTMGLLRSTAKDIAKAAHGVVVDPQDGTRLAPAGVKRFVPPKGRKTFPVLNLSWWFLTDALADRAGRMAFLGLLEKHLPEALPRRYGDYEPPKHVFASRGKDHLQSFMERNMSTVMVWSPNRPVVDVHVSCPMPAGASHQGFRSNLVEIEVEAAALDQPGWARHLRQFWRHTTHLLQPIYGEVRTTHGHSRFGGVAYVDAAMIQTTYPDTTRGWFWRGIPRKLGHAVVLGKQYQREWPTFMAHADVERGLAFASMPDWSRSIDLTQRVGEVPRELALHPGEGMGRGQAYPTVWPFGPVFDPDE